MKGRPRGKDLADPEVRRRIDALKRAADENASQLKIVTAQLVVAHEEIRILREELGAQRIEHRGMPAT